MSSQYPTAVCRSCGEPIYNGEGTPNRKGEWICYECEKVKKHDK
jgi:formylmethanofuran dehydrogenase subunit E